MKDSFVSMVASRYLITRKREAFISFMSVIACAGVAVGVAVLILVMSVMTGFQHELRSKILAANAHIVVRRVGTVIPHWEQITKKIKEHSSVQSATAFTYTQGLIRNNNATTGILVRGVEEGGLSELKKSFVESNVLEQLYQSDQLQPPILIGRELAHQLGVQQGDIVTVLSPEVTPTPFGLVPKYQRFRIAGTYATGLVEYEAGLAYITLPDAQRLFGFGATVTGVEIRLLNPDEAPAVAEQIVSQVKSIVTGLYAQPWTETNKPLWDALKLEKKVYFLVLLLIIIMASFTIITTLVMIVLEKRRDIAIMLSFGVTPSMINSLFRRMGLTIGICGTVLGVLLGCIAAVALDTYGFPLDERVFQMSKLPVELDPFNVMLIALASLIISAVATIYPARKASSLHPAEILRLE